MIHPNRDAGGKGGEVCKFFRYSHVGCGCSVQRVERKKYWAAKSSAKRRSRVWFDERLQEGVGNRARFDLWYQSKNINPGETSFTKIDSSLSLSLVPYGFREMFSTLGKFSFFKAGGKNARVRTESESNLYTAAAMRVYLWVGGQRGRKVEKSFPYVGHVCFPQATVRWVRGWDELWGKRANRNSSRSEWDEEQPP